MYKLKRQTSRLKSGGWYGKYVVLPFLFTLFTFVPLLRSGQAFAQEQSKIIDSLLAVLETVKEDTNKAITLYELCWHYRTIDQEIALKYCDQSLNLSKQLDFQKGIAYSLTKSGVVYRIQKDYEKAIEYLQQGLKVSEKSEMLGAVAWSLNNIAGCYYEQDNYEKVLEYEMKTLKIRKKLGDKYGIAMTMYNIGEAYCLLSKHGESIEYFTKSLAIAKEKGWGRIKKANYEILVEAYTKLNNQKEMEKYEKLLSTFSESN
ncbi:MAG: tetratricopeptide repeat protein [Cytophagales bacterium]|nr:tetratricopeptide repeat protein [Cytophagales bacterium]